MDWKEKYIRRVMAEIELNKRTPMGNLKVEVYIFDLLEESGLCKTGFYNTLFMINELLSEHTNGKIVLYIRNYIPDYFTRK